MPERLHKVLAQHGLGSRREVERWITEGRIALNGRRAKTGDAWNEGDVVQLDGRDISKRLQRQVAAQVLAYHKPQGQLIAVAKETPAADLSEESSETIPVRGDTWTETVQDRLPALRGSRWLPINPMHAGDSGLLLVTNDGALSYALTRQKKWIPTSYMVRVHVRGGLAQAPVLPTSLKLDDGEVVFTKVAVVGDPLEVEGESAAGNVWYQVDMPRADKRAAVRALFVSHNLSISRMTQISFGPISLTRDMPRARHVQLDAKQLEQLYALAKLPLPVQPGVLTGKFSGKPLKRGNAKRSTRTAEDDASETVRPAGRGGARSRKPLANAGGRSSGTSRAKPQGRRPSSRRS